ncbi:MAG: SagB/ThcOx family dehydrogenase [Candidatus Margulisiibacteriota bacterium]
MQKSPKAIRIAVCCLFCLTIILGVHQALSKNPPLATIKLPEPRIDSAVSLENSIKNRRSERSFLSDELTLAQISQLLWAAQGITDPDWGLRAAPSAGAIYPLEIYVVRPSGIFHFVPEKNILEQTSNQDRRSALAQAALGQSFVEEAPAVFVLAANFIKVRQKYGGRTERYVYIETGHAAENLLLEATALGLGAIPVGAFWDDIAKRMLALPEELFPIYLIPVGYVARQ